MNLIIGNVVALLASNLSSFTKDTLADGAIEIITV